MAVTRFYWRRDETPPVSPAFHSGWNDTSEALRRMMYRTKLAGDTVTFTSISHSAASTFALHLQLVSEPLVGGQTLGGSGIDVEAVTHCLESAGNDDLIDALGVSIYQADGDTIELSATVTSQQSAEWPFTGQSPAGRLFIQTTGVGGYTTQEGDRLVIEVGSEAKPSSVMPASGHIRRGSNSSGADAQNGSTSSTEVPWCEINITTVVQGDTPESGWGVILF